MPEADFQEASSAVGIMPAALVHRCLACSPEIGPVGLLRESSVPPTLGLALPPSLALEAAVAAADQALPQCRCVEAPAIPSLMLHVQPPPVRPTRYGILVN
ncbi:hypothetical protein D623_10007100 [Myotis brandtii]|uniref:Uncharacterized protein n=1 Tax=Myotis brandtii TaxID=109478 RepID=S7NM41_MYOBR|nr:hypothetical protein D623_10007100 [Myotis brandtii]